MDSPRVIHIVNRLNPGGVERWLVGVVQALADSDIKTDVLVHSEESGEYDALVKQCGSNIVVCKHSKNPFVYSLRLFKALRKGNYNVVHSHVHHFSGLVLFIAWMSGVKKRIAHSHSNRSQIEPQTGVRAWYLKAMKFLIRWFATNYIAVSQEASFSLFGSVVSKPSIQILYCGIGHLDKIDRKAFIRDDFNLTHKGIVVGHIGRLSVPKNHSFLLDIFGAILQKTDAHLVLIGDGELKSEIVKKIQELNIADKVLMLGARNDAVDIMASLFDVMPFPSLYEGLPLTVVEAQSAGVPVVMADNLTKEAIFDNTKVRYLSHSDTVDIWAQRIIKSARQVKSPDTSLYKQTDFYMPNHLQKLKDLYSTD
ncbi:glycosyltransferase [Ningiella sp. W23]|uniref:glycosyltransferase n=1 Tax=Ningiella sp. W23 TaxID=3023715 RepID=UPI003756AD2B